MIYISAQPATIYYAWQVEVYINNFIQNEVFPNDIHVLFLVDGDIPQEIQVLQRNYPHIHFYFYNDTRTDKSYIPSIYFNAVKQHILAHPELEKETILFHDSDTILTKPLNLSWQVLNNKIWYMSDTNSYINYNYIMQKGNDVYERMLNIVGIDGTIPKLLNSHSGGAQYLLKGAPFAFWNKVEKDSIDLYRMFCETEHLYEPKHEGDYPIQKWTAGMWSFLWNAWYFGFETLVTDELSFCWATDVLKRFDETQFMHNAGVTQSSDEYFHKGAWSTGLPYNKTQEVLPKFCSYKYWQCIKDVEKKSPLTNL